MIPDLNVPLRRVLRERDSEAGEFTIADAGAAKRVPVSLRGYDHKVVSEETSFHTGEESVVQQHLGVEADVNTIVRRFGATGEVPVSRAAAAVYGDFTGLGDLDTASAVVERADAAFMSLPPDVRERFKNDPREVVRLAQSVSVEEFVEHLKAPAKKSESAPLSADVSAVLPSS